MATGRPCVSLMLARGDQELLLLELSRGNTGCILPRTDHTFAPPLTSQRIGVRVLRSGLCRGYVGVKLAPLELWRLLAMLQETPLKMLLFTNARLCNAVLDRLTDQAHIIETGSESYRFRRTLRMKNRAPSTSTSQGWVKTSCQSHDQTTKTFDGLIVNLIATMDPQTYTLPVA